MSLWHYGYLAVVCPNSSPSTSCTPLHCTVHFDALYILFGKSQINIIAIICCCMNHYVNWHLFLAPDLRLMAKLRDVIVYDQWRGYFMAPKIKGKSVCAITRRNFMWTLNMFQSLALTFRKMQFTVFLNLIISNV